MLRSTSLSYTMLYYPRKQPNTPADKAKYLLSSRKNLGGIFMEKQELINWMFNHLQTVIIKEKTAEAKLLITELTENIIYLESNQYRPQTNKDAIQLFISAKEVEGCSHKSTKYYQTTLTTVLNKIDKVFYLVTTEDIRFYLSAYKEYSCVSRQTIDNVRRVISSFYAWLESEDYIAKSPSKRIHKVKIGKAVKDVYSEEAIVLIKQATKNKRDLAIIDFLYSTGIRVGELVRLNRTDIDFDNMECIVLGKGNKQRKVYFDAKTKIHLKQYLHTRKDDNEALFVSELSPYNRLKISGVEIMLRKLGNSIGIPRVHPHKFRRTLATKAIDKGMPIEQVQHLLGHAKIDTTLEYAMVDDANVKLSHKKYLE